MKHQFVLLINNQVAQRYITLKKFIDGISLDGQEYQDPREVQNPQIIKEGQDIRNDYIFTLQETGEESFNCI